MSGGHYNYQTLQVGYLADEIEGDCEVLCVDGPVEAGGYYRKAEPPEIIAAMRQCVADLRIVGARAKAIEWYLSGDYGPEAVLVRDGVA